MKVQVKREAGTVAPDQVRGFMSLIGESEVGIFFNVGGFSRGTHEEVRKQMTRQVTLIDDEGFNGPRDGTGELAPAHPGHVNRQSGRWGEQRLQCGRGWCVPSSCAFGV